MRTVKYILLWLIGCIVLATISTYLRIPVIGNFIIGIFWGGFMSYLCDKKDGNKNS